MFRRINGSPPRLVATAGTLFRSPMSAFFSPLRLFFFYKILLIQMNLSHIQQSLKIPFRFHKGLGWFRICIPWHSGNDLLFDKFRVQCSDIVENWWGLGIFMIYCQELKAPAPRSGSRHHQNPHNILHNVLGSRYFRPLLYDKGFIHLNAVYGFCSTVRTVKSGLSLKALQLSVISLQFWLPGIVKTK